MAINIHSETWKSVLAYCHETRKQLVHELIEGTPNDDLIRGRIHELDNLMKLERPDNPPPIHSANYL